MPTVTVQDIYITLDGFAPFASMPDWDNSGLLIGNPKSEVTKAALCLDVTAETIRQAKESGAQLMVSHHPLLFKPVQKILAQSPEYQLIEAGISLISLHIPLDYLPDGPNQMLCRMLGLSPVGLLGEREIGGRAVCDGVIGETPLPLSPAEFAAQAANTLGTPIHYSDHGKPLRRIGICGGSGGFLMEEAIRQGCDALFTGECKHHELLEAEASGLTLLVGGHYATEKHIPALLKEKLEKIFPQVEWMICQQTDPCGKVAE